MRLRIFTMSEKPISSSRAARRKAVGDVVTVCNDPPLNGSLCAGMTRDYSLLHQMPSSEVTNQSGGEL